MSAGGDHRGHGGPHDPEFRVGRGKPARRRIAALAVAIIVIIFAVMLGVWLLGRSAADAQSPAGAGGADHSAEAEPAADGGCPGLDRSGQRADRTA
ncbi:hypothetical protein ACI8AG_11400 [Blastococcus sp. SYSU DS0552]